MRSGVVACRVASFHSVKLAMPPRAAIALLLLTLVSSSDTRAAAMGATDSLAWTQVVADSMSNGYARGGVAMVFDSRRDRVIALCGANLKLCYIYPDQHYYEDIRVLDPGQPTGWDILPVAGGPRRWGAAAAYDSIGDRVFLFGGKHDDGSPAGDLWILDLATTTTWSQVPAPGPSPSPRWFHTLTLDPIRQRLILFGGADAAGPLGDIWEMPLAQPGAWGPLATSGPAPSPRGEHLAVYEPGSDCLLITGGVGAPADTARTWQLSLTGSPVWSVLSTSGGPSWHTIGGIDTRRGRIVAVSTDPRVTVRAFSLPAGPWIMAAPAGRDAFPFYPPVLPQSSGVLDPRHDLIAFSWDQEHTTYPISRASPCEFNELGTTFMLRMGTLPTVTVSATLDSIGFAFGHTIERWTVSPDRVPYSAITFGSDWRGSYVDGYRSFEITGPAVIHASEQVPIAAPYHVGLRWFDGQKFATTPPILVTPPPPPTNVGVRLVDSLRVSGGSIHILLSLDSDSLWFMASTTLDRRKDGGAWQQVYTAFPGLDGSFGIWDGSVPPNTMYEYRVRWREEPPSGSQTFSILTPPVPVFDSSHVEPRRIAMYWHSLPGANLAGRIKKSAPMGVGWPDTFAVQTNAEGRMIFIDDAVEPATYYNYQLTWFEGGVERLSTDIGLATPHDPSGPGPPTTVLALSAPYPNPTAGGFQSTIIVPAGAPASAALFDIAGRLRWSRTLPAGAIVLQVPALSLESGIYSLIVRQGNAIQKRSVVVLE
jgi:hypothetical protein